jgi:hypothetical protein
MEEDRINDIMLEETVRKGRKTQVCQTLKPLEIISPKRYTNTGIGV